MKELTDGTERKRQRLELTEGEQTDIRTAMVPFGYRSLHQFVRDVILFLVKHPDVLKTVMRHMEPGKER